MKKSIISLVVVCLILIGCATTVSVKGYKDWGFIGWFTKVIVEYKTEESITNGVNKYAKDHALTEEERIQKLEEELSVIKDKTVFIVTISSQLEELIKPASWSFYLFDDNNNRYKVNKIIPPSKIDFEIIDTTGTGGYQEKYTGTSAIIFSYIPSPETKSIKLLITGEQGKKEFIFKVYTKT